MAVWSVISHTEVGSGGVASIAISSINPGYDHLNLKYSVRREGSGVDDGFLLFLNATTGTNYSTTTLRALSGSPNSYQNGNQGAFNLGNWAGTGATANTFGIGEVWIPHYSNTTNSKQMFISNSVENLSSSSYRMSINACTYWPQEAVHTITMYNASSDIAEFSTFTLYGIIG